MDSYSYENLLPGNGTGNSPIATAVWNDFSFDGNDVTPETLSPTYWQQGAGGICRFQTRVCGWRQNGVVVSQNNWLFTQHISSDFDSNIYNYDVTIHVEATYSLQSCRVRQGCIQRFNLLHYMTNSQQLPSTSGNGYMNTQNYENFAVPEGPVSSKTYTNTYNFTLPPSSTGFYIAVQDIGSCIALSRLRVYRNNCKSRQVGLVRYPDAPAPVSGSANIDISCVENAVVSGSSEVTCFSNGTWGPETPVCQCKCGYEPNRGATRCNACPANQWSDGTVCLQCPASTKTTQEAACSCPCKDGYFRNNETSTEKRQYESPVDEDFTYGCTKPPSAPSNVLLPATNTSITVRWSAPADLGGRTADLYYQVEISDPDNLGSYIGTVCVPGSTEMRIFTGLRPCTDYCVRVTAENGVSDQDPTSKDSRTATQCIRTKEGWFGPVKDLQCFEQVVVWERPEMPGDCELDQYQVIVRKNDMEIKRFRREQSFLVLENTPELRGVSGTLFMEVSVIAFSNFLS
ncbi:Ephrin type-A receptor 5 [Geodia barretti]|uniref:Ephrin type-A receptor 5 n=1 Tax=Geodia barretti TaxID=519541 RepID=A0AA35TI84_GEOBA|nr:Ephrin type-A receptor 5 [Geodia barretti]